MKVSFLAVVLFLIQLQYLIAKNNFQDAGLNTEKARRFIKEKKPDSVFFYFDLASKIYQQNDEVQAFLSNEHELYKYLIHQARYEDVLLRAHQAIEFSGKNKHTPKDEFNSIIASIFNDIGMCYDSKSLYDSAFVFYQKSLSIKEKIYASNHIRLSNSYKNIGLLMNQTGKYEKALGYLKKSLEIEIRSLGVNSSEVGKTFNDLGLVYSNIGNYQQAILLYEKSIEIITANNGENLSLLSNIYNNIGTAYFYQGLYSKALEYYENTLNIEKKVYEQHPKIAITLNNIGALYNKMGNNELAIEYFKNALNLMKKYYDENHSDIAAAYSNIGYVSHNLGYFEEAMLNYKKTLKIQYEIYNPIHPEIALTLNKIASLYEDKNELKLALEFYEKSLQIRKKVYGEYHADLAVSLNNIGVVYNKLDKSDEALKYLNQALKIQKKIFVAGHPEVAITYNNISNCYYSKNEYQKALGFLGYSMNIYKEYLSEKHPEKAKVLNNIGNIYRRMGLLNRALESYQRALFLNTKSFSDTLSLHENPYTDDVMNRKVLLRTLELKAKTLEELFTSSKEISYLNTSLNTFYLCDSIIENIRNDYLSQDDKIILGKTAKKIYEGAIKTCFSLLEVTTDKKYLEQAFLFIEKSKAKALYSAMLNSRAISFAGIPDSLLRKESNLKSEIAFLKSEIVKEKIIRKTLDINKINVLNNQLYEKTASYNKLIDVFENNYPNYYRLKYDRKVLTVSEIQRQLRKENESLVEYFYGDSSLHIFNISSDTVMWKSQKISPSLLDKIKGFNDGLLSVNFEKYTDNAYQLFQILINPISKNKENKNLIIVPDGPLWNINFEALLTEKSNIQDYNLLPYLIKDNAISYAYSSSLLFFQSNDIETETKEINLLGFAFLKIKEDSLNDGLYPKLSLIDLPGSRKEIENVSEEFEGRFFIGLNASEKNFKKFASGYSIIHLALHGEVNNQNPENSRLVFTQNKDNIEDNILYAHEIYNLSLDTELIVLSACNTASGKLANGEGLMSLGRAFMYAGCKSQLISQWQLTDSFTPDIMKRFYNEIKRGEKKNVALRNAKLKYIENANNLTGNPLFWAALIHVGDNKALVKEKTVGTLLYYFGALLLIFVVFYFGTTVLIKRK